jgi:hypothetical protein
LNRLKIGVCRQTSAKNFHLNFGKMVFNGLDDDTETDGQTLLLFLNTHCSLKAYCAILVRRFNFRHQASPGVSPRESTQRRKVELWARNVREFCLNADLHVTFRDLLHAVKLRHGTGGFTFPPKKGVP